MINCVKCGSIEKLPNGKCKQCKKNTRDKYRAANKEKFRLQAKEYYEATKHHQLAVQKAKRMENPELYAQRVKAWVDINSERMSELRKKWKAENKDRVCAHSQDRRAKIAKSGGVLHEKEITNLRKAQKNKCAICHTSIEKHFHADHIMPLAKGGLNVIANIQLLCPKCNLQKGAKHPVDFMQSKGFLL